MAPSTQQTSQKDASPDMFASEKEPYISDSEIDSYIISRPHLAKKAPKVLEATRRVRDPSTPKRPKSSSHTHQCLTPPQTNQSGPLKSQQSSTAGRTEDAQVPKTPSKKKAHGVFGTDSRVWSASGFKSPCKPSRP